MKTSGLGVDGERLAREYLEASGFKVLEQNFKSRFGEIDIIATKGRYLCFVEVKTRSSKGNLATGLESISLAKQQRIIKSAEYYLATHRAFVSKAGLQPRFDCMEINVDDDINSADIRLIEIAFCIE
ncbi:MAG: YraN family protein [Clostridia bacterium]|nr:YraN family protein [Clostridia bacterium]